MLGNGTAPKVVGQITIHLLENGQVGFNCQVPGDPTIAFDMLGKTVALLSAEVQRQKQQQIEVAPAGLINRISQG